MLRAAAELGEAGCFDAAEQLLGRWRRGGAGGTGGDNADVNAVRPDDTGNFLTLSPEH